MSDLRTQRLSRLLDQNVVIYARPIKMEWVYGEGLGWRITAERVFPHLYMTLDGEDLDETLDKMIYQVRRKLLIIPTETKRKRKTPKRARRKQ